MIQGAQAFLIFNPCLRIRSQCSLVLQQQQFQSTFVADYSLMGPFQKLAYLSPPDQSPYSKLQWKVQAILKFQTFKGEEWNEFRLHRQKYQLMH
ncbi:hypothetical protein FGO68_gene5159 [Halteria grandinella]|uniref:Uncharacterized protein n=1 Tax=Halteria grandinella TaxID=5974 RepID=A0A8J8NXD8_HALGN|nr:hypothetical protein FGO68_gene5159 [Halteria grandinella]